MTSIGDLTVPCAQKEVEEVYVGYYLMDSREDPSELTHYGIWRNLEQAIEFVRERALEAFDSYYDGELECKPEFDGETGRKKGLVYLFKFLNGRENYCIEKLKFK